MKKAVLIGLIAAIVALALLFAAIRSALDGQQNVQPGLSGDRAQPSWAAKNWPVAPEALTA